MQQISNKNLNISYFNNDIDYGKTHKCVFLDRDGVIVEDVGYLSSIQDIKFIDGVFETLAYLKKEGFLIGIVTNQSGIARGFFTVKQFIKVQTHINKVLKEHSIELDFIIACPYLLDGNPPYNKEHNFRKPRPGMINEVLRNIMVDKETSFLVGDKLTDIESAKRAGLKKSFLFLCSAIKISELDSLNQEGFSTYNIKKIDSIIAHEDQ